MQRKVISIGISCLVAIAALCACGGESPTDSGSLGNAEPVAVDNRVKIGGNNWIFEPGESEEIVKVGAIESFEVVNETDEDIAPEVGFGNVLFREIHNGCSNIVLKPGESCVVRGEWVRGGARKTTLDVAVTRQNVPNAAKEGISVPLGASSASDVPAGRTISPTPASTSTASPSPSETSTTATPTPTPSSSTTGTQTPSSSPTPTPTATPTLGGSSRR